MPSISALHDLKQVLRVPDTDDSPKYFPPSISQSNTSGSSASETKAKLLKVYTNNQGFRDTLSKEESQAVFGVVLDRTNFYAEGGGQVSDTGRISVFSNEQEPVFAKVVDVQSYGNHVLLGQ